MEIAFLGTRGNIERRSRLHRRHSALMVKTVPGRVMFDCGADWTERVFSLAPDAIFITHAHLDHADGLKFGAPCPVYASAETWRLLSSCPVVRRRTIVPKRLVRESGLCVRAYRLIHSLLAPAVGYRVEAEGAAFFYAPDIVAIVEPEAALKGVCLYIGDGAALTRPIVRRRGGALFGHATIRTQLSWCAEAGVPEAVLTHCGTQIVAMDGRTAAARVRRIGKEQGVRASLAVDGLVLSFP
jgi:phosphoribosyl 1,2-cyclic phosphodiesterase